MSLVPSRERAALNPAPPYTRRDKMQSPQDSKELVSVVELKDLARRLLPRGSALRDLILSEPDAVPRDEVIIKVRMYSRLLQREAATPA
jgi:hypothetical protein